MRTRTMTLTLALLILAAFGGGCGGGEVRAAGAEGAKSMKESGMQWATFGGGCFWCIEAVFEGVRGVEEVVSGYAGGEEKNPGYYDVGSGRTGHAEVVQIRFDPEVVSYEDLATVFFAMHDPTTPDRQGADVGPQYRSIVLTHDDAQRAVVDALIRKLEADDAYGAPIVTEVKPFEAFYPAEPEHQDYYARNSNQGYCRVVISPKLKKLKDRYSELLR